MKVDDQRHCWSTCVPESQSSGERFGGRGEAPTVDETADWTSVRAAPSSRNNPQITDEIMTRPAVTRGSMGNGQIMIDRGRGQNIHVNRDFDAESLARVLDRRRLPAPTVCTTVWRRPCRHCCSANGHHPASASKRRAGCHHRQCHAASAPAASDRRHALVDVFMLQQIAQPWPRDA
jgi:hypothetical protein